MPISIRSCRTGLLGGLLGACAAAMAASPEPDGSLERPYPHLRQAAVHVVETARSALASRGESPGAAPPVAVAHTKAVSPELVDAVRDVFSGAGGRQTVSGAWLEVILETQSSQQSGAYTPAPREGLEQADLVLAIDEAQAASGLTHVRGALLTLRAGGPEQEYGAGEIVPGSNTSVYVRAPDTAGLVVRGEGYCNRDFPSDRWRYSAFKAAEVDAAAALARATGRRCGNPAVSAEAAAWRRTARRPGPRGAPERRRREPPLRSFELPCRGDAHRYRDLAAGAARRGPRVVFGPAAAVLAGVHFLLTATFF